VALAETVSPLLASGVPRYEWTSAVSASDGVDFFKITAPAAGSGRLIARVAGVGLNQPEVRLRVVDAEGQSVGTAAKLHSDGTFSVEVAAPAGGEDYFLRISVDPSSQVGVGNYVVTAGFGVPAEQMNHVVSGQVDGELDKFIRWTAAKTKLFRFDLTADSSEPQQAVQLTVYDAHTRTVKMVAVARGGMTRSVLGWLQQGEYMLRLTALSLGDAPVATSDFTIHADGLSDDQDEDPYDPGDDPTYDPYNYSYEPDPYDYQYDPGEPYYDPYYDDPYYYQV
jgi:hypothetical protein